MKNNAGRYTLGVHYFSIILRAVECLNLIGWRMFWGVQLFSGTRMANVDSRQLSWPHYSSVSLHQIISVISKVLQQKNNQNPQRHWPNKKNTVNKMIKSTDLVHVLPQNYVLLCTESTAYYLSPALGLSLKDTHIVYTHLNKSADVVSTTLTILSVT